MNKIKGLLKIFFAITICFPALGTDGENKDSNRTGVGSKRSLDIVREEKAAKKLKTTIELSPLDDICTQFSEFRFQPMEEPQRQETLKTLERSLGIVTEKRAAKKLKLSSLDDICTQFSEWRCQSTEKEIQRREMLKGLEYLRDNNFFENSEDMGRALDLSLALAGVETKAQIFAGPCYLNSLPSKILWNILNPGLVDSQDTSLQGIESLMNLRCSNKFFMEFIDESRLRNDSFTILSFSEIPAKSFNFRWISNVFPHMKNLTLLYQDIKTCDFDVFKKLTSLTKLFWRQDTGPFKGYFSFTNLLNLTNLFELSLENFETSEQLQHLSKLPKLTKLNLRLGTSLSSEIHHLSSLINLNSLDLGLCDIKNGGENFQPLSYLTNLTELDLSYNEYFAGYWDDEEGALDWPKGTGLNYLVGLKKLKKLKLGGDMDFDENHPDLQLFSHLTELKLKVF